MSTHSAEPNPTGTRSMPMGDPTKQEVFGHPKGLYVLFGTEMWERFSFYTMRGIMTLYVVQIVLATIGATSEGAAAIDRLIQERAAIGQTLTVEEARKVIAGGQADQIYGAYLGFVYAATFIGGLLADRLLGQRKAIYIGGVLMAMAHFTLTTHAILVTSSYHPGELNILFFLGLGLLACGNGFFKPNISTIVGTLYKPEDARRDSAFTIFYMGINIGATAAAFMSGAAQKWAWYLGYLVAGLGMIVSLVILLGGSKLIGRRGLPPAGASLIKRGRLGIPNVIPLLLGVLVFIPLAGYLMSTPGVVQNLSYFIAAIVLAYLIYETVRGTREESGRMTVIIVLCLFSMVFWGFFELQGSTITRFVEDKVNLHVFKWDLPAAFVANFVNPFLIILLGIPFSWLWLWLDRKGMEPSSPLKFSFGLLQLGLGFLMLWIGAGQALAGGKSALIWPMLAYLMFTMGELCLSPVGLSMITKLSPVRLVGVFMGVWFLVSALGNVLTGGIVGPKTEAYGYGPVFLAIAGICGVAAVLLFALTPPLKSRMHGIK